MQTIHVTVPWQLGLHLRPATKLVQVAGKFRSQIQLQFESTVADGRSVLSLLLLSATLGSELSVQALGDDEHEAIQALQNVFTSEDGDEGITAAAE